MTFAETSQTAGPSESDQFWFNAFGRSLGIVSSEELRKLARARVAIPGLGGVGGAHLITLVRAGIGKFHIADPDVFELANFNRQSGARLETLGKPKVDVMKADALGINPHLDVRVFREGVSADNVDEFLEGVDVVVDGIDFFSWRTRRLVYNRARKKGIPVVAAGPVGLGQTLLVFTSEGMGFDAYYDIGDETSDLDACLKFLVGTTPSLAHTRYMSHRRFRPEARVAPSFGTACALDAGAAATEVVRIVLGWPGLRPAPHYLLYDPRLRRLYRGKLRWGNRGPLQRLKLLLAHRELHRNMSSFRPGRRGPVWNGVGPIPDAVRDHILTAGLEAPSVENDQPWKYRLRKDAVDVLIDRSLEPPFINPRFLASTMTAGAVIENMRIAASVYGLKAEIIDGSLDEAEGRAATVTFVPGAAPDPLARVLGDRETNRHFYDQRPLSPESAHALEEAAAGVPGARLRLVTDRGAISLLRQAVEQTIVVRFNILSEQKHLARLIRSSLGEAKKTGDGVTARNLLLRPGASLLMPLLASKGPLTALNRLGITRLFAWDICRPVTRSGALGFITVPGISSKDFLAGGRALERVWLTAAAWDLSVQPLAGVPLFWLCHRLDNGDGSFPERARPPFHRAMELARRACPEIDFDREGVVMLFRIGRAVKPLPEGTFRKPLSHFLIS